MRMGKVAGRTIAVGAAAAAGLALGCVGPASAIPYPSPVSVNPDDFRIGDSVYFDLGYGQSCVIRPNGDVGCDFPQGLLLTTSSSPFRPTVNDLAIDNPSLPAHPEFHQQGRPDSAPLRSSNDTGGGFTITYVGATCSVGGFHGSWGCQSKGHSFGGGGGYNSVS